MKKSLIFSFGLFFLLSCKKKDAPAPTCNRDVAGISGTYKITAIRYKATPTATEVDYYAFLLPNPCDKDDLYAFNSNGTYVINDAGIICVPSNSYNSTWSLSGNIITIDGDPGNIDNFSCSTLTVSASDALVTGDKLIVVFTRQ